MAASLTAATAVIMITIPGIFNSPQQLQQFAADDIFSTDPIAPAEVSMGVDGILSAGFVFVPVKQKFSLQANSPSVTVFDNWYGGQQVALDVFEAAGLITLTSLKKKYALVRGFLTGHPLMPDAGRTLKPLSYEITWQQVTGQPG